MKKYLASLITIILSASLLFYYYGDVVSSPNDYAFALGGDGVKNYYTPAYYIANDSGIHFSGMNYPYGEHVIFTDNQFFLSALFSFIHKNIIELDEHVIGIFNSLMLWSIVLTALLLFLIFRELKMEHLWASIFAIAIAFMSPQIFRFVGHYALAYSSFIPLLIYLLLKSDRSKNTKEMLTYAVLLMLAILVFAFIQPYYLLMGGLFALVFGGIKLLMDKKTERLTSLLISSAGVLSIVIFFVWLKSTDPYIDRLSDPWGFFKGLASFESVFLPTEGPVYDVLNPIFNIRVSNWEGVAYAGLAVWIVFIRLLELIITAVKNKSMSKFKRPVLESSLTILLLTSFVLYLFSMGIPFKWNMEWLLDVLSPIKQFRSLGRFAWLVFYALSIFSAYHLYLLVRRNRAMDSVKQKVLMSLIVVTTIFWIVEGKWYNEARAQTITNKLEGKNVFYNVQGKFGWNKNNSQAILPLPYTHMGSEKMYIARSSRAMFDAMALSYDTGVPLLTGEMSRTSQKVTFDMVQLMSDPLIYKVLRNDLNEKPIIVVYDGNEELNRWEQRIIDAAEWKDEGHGYYVISPKVFEDIIDSKLQFIKENKDSLNQYGNFYSEHEMQALYHDGFEEVVEVLEGQEPLAGSFCYYKEDGHSTLFDIMNRDTKARAVEFSIWVGNPTNRSAYPTIEYVVYTTDGKEIERQYIHPQQSMDIYNGWVRVEWKGELLPFHRHLIIMVGEGQIVDELLIREEGVDVYEDKDGTWWLNNYPLLKTP